MDLSTEEMDCLKRISHGTPETDAPCDAHTLNSLMDKGLIEQVRICLPIEMASTRYYITQSGRIALSAHDQ